MEFEMLETETNGTIIKVVGVGGAGGNAVQHMINRGVQGVDFIVIAPIVETGWEPVLREAKRAKIPVLVTDRTVQVSDESLYVCFIGSDFYAEGKMAAEWLAAKVNGKGNIVELQGTPGSAPTNERRKSFADGIAKFPGLKLIDSQSGDFRRSGGKEVMEAFLKKHGKAINVVYAHNDDMALGAIQAIEEAGLKPGKDITVLSIDGIKEALQAVVAGKLGCSVECNPLFGPKVYDTISAVLAGKTVAKKLFNVDTLFDAKNTAAIIASREY